MSEELMSFHLNSSTATRDSDWLVCSDYSCPNRNFNDFDRVVDRFVAALSSQQPLGFWLEPRIVR
jgi:hypothetical protein